AHASRARTCPVGEAASPTCVNRHGAISPLIKLPPGSPDQMYSMRGMPEQHPKRLRGAELVERRLQLSVHARRRPGEAALCGDPGFGKSTTKRSEVTCKLCVAEIERRLEAGS